MEATATSENKSADSDAIVVNDVTTVVNNPRTPVASRAQIQDPTTASTTPQASASLIPASPSSPGNVMMIREWDGTPALPQLQVQRGASPMIPIASSELITSLTRDESNGSPAATVRAVAIVGNVVTNIATNFVRTVSTVSESVMQRSQTILEIPSSSHVAIETPITTATAADDCNSNDGRINNHSVPPIPVAPELPDANAGNDGRNIMADIEDEQQESYFINGEIVTITRENPKSKSDRQISKSSRMQRGVRKIKKLRKIFSGGRNARGESSRRKRRDSRGQLGYEDVPQNTDYVSTESIEVSVSGRSQILEAPNNRPRRDTVSDGGYESGDGESLIEAPNSHHCSTFAAIQSNNNNTPNIISSLPAQRNWHSEQLNGPSSNLSVNSGSTSQGQKKKINGLAKWLRGATSDSSSANRSMGTHASGLSAKNKSQKSPPSSSNKSKPSIPKLSRMGRRGFSPNPSPTSRKPAALTSRQLSQGLTAPLMENSNGLSLNSLSRPSQPPLMADSILHAQPMLNNRTGSQSLVPLDPDQNDLAARASLVEAEVLSYYTEDRFDEYDKYGSKKKKHDNQDGPCIDNLMQRAREIAEMAAGNQDEDAPLKLPPSQTKSGVKRGKSDGESVPLSVADPDDQLVHNDYLKLILVGDNAVDKSGLGRALRRVRGSPKESTKLEVKVFPWNPSNADVNFKMWEVIASKSEDNYLPNFGARPGTQSLFFSDLSLYLLVYDLGANNPATFRHYSNSQDTDSEDDDGWNEEPYNAYEREKKNRRADQALRADIEERVLLWVNCIAQRMTHSAILPIALKPQNMTLDEAIRRCDMMQSVILDYEQKLPRNIARPQILRGEETVVCVSLDDNTGIDYLEKMILEIADSRNKVFRHVGTRVPPGTVEIMKTCKRFKREKISFVPVDHLVAKLPKRPEFSTDAVMEVLCFLATIGEVLYFGRSDSILKDYVILKRHWLVEALLCFLQNNLHQELSEIIKMEKIFFNENYSPESQVKKTFSGNNSSCPILSSQDTQMLWQNYGFLMDAVSKPSHLSERLTPKSTKVGFLQHLLVQRNVFLPLDINPYHSTEKIFFVPSLLPKASSRDVWTYKNIESWMVTLCHSWLFRDGAPAGVMEQITVALLRDLYESSIAHVGTPARLQRNQSFGLSPMANFTESRGIEPVGPIKIYQINCWQKSLLLKIGRVFPGENDLDSFESRIEIFITVIDRLSPHSVASDAMRSNMQRLVVSGKGEVGSHGQKLWKAGYNIVLDSIKASMANYANVERQVVCPECLSQRQASSANTWSWDSILAAPDRQVRCMIGHPVDRHLLCGTAPMITRPEDIGEPANTDRRAVKDILPSIVLVGLWDKETKEMVSVGSGFIASKKGLIVTASHTIFKMDKGRDFGAPYQGLRSASVIIGVIRSHEGNDTSAVFRYVAKIVADDVHCTDACILKITGRLENDVLNHTFVGKQPERVLKNIQEESLVSLKLTNRYEIEQNVRIIGFNQGGEGRLESGRHVNRTPDFAIGYICRKFIPADDESSSSSSSDDSSSCEEVKLLPKEEIVVNCFTIVGHSGGPCVNNEGKVVGILSRSDPTGQRCYLVPSSEIKKLITKAKNSAGMGY